LEIEKAKEFDRQQNVESLLNSFDQVLFIPLQNGLQNDALPLQKLRKIVGSIIASIPEDARKDAKKMKEIRDGLAQRKAEVTSRYKAEIREGSRTLKTAEDLEGLVGNAEEELKRYIQVLWTKDCERT
jgi:hypothetical protein